MCLVGQKDEAAPLTRRSVRFASSTTKTSKKRLLRHLSKYDDSDPPLSTNDSMSRETNNAAKGFQSSKGSSAKLSAGTPRASWMRYMTAPRYTNSSQNQNCEHLLHLCKPRRRPLFDQLLAPPRLNGGYIRRAPQLHSLLQNLYPSSIRSNAPLQ